MDKFVIKKSALKKSLITKPKNYDSRYAITFGEVAILHVGGKEIGNGIREQGFTTTELKLISEKLGDLAEYISISDSLPEHLKQDNDAGILVIRCNSESKTDDTIPVSKDFANRLYLEQKNKVTYDNKYWDNRRGKTLNKRARENIVFGAEEIEHSDDYRQSSVKSFSNLPELLKIKSLLPNIIGNKANGLNAEGNHYHQPKSGIGYHGDAERKIVICLSLGKSSILRYNWRMPGSSEHTHKPIDVEVNHGDIYIMSEKATGFDWKKRSKVRVVHGAGYKSYIDK